MPPGTVSSARNGNLARIWAISAAVGSLDALQPGVLRFYREAKLVQ